MLHSIEETDGLRFLTMEHVEGETLNKAIPPRGLLSSGVEPSVEACPTGDRARWGDRGNRLKSEVDSVST